MPLRKIDQVTRWRKTGVDRYGQEEYGDPVVLTLRWEDFVTETMTKEGDTFNSLGVVYGDVADELRVDDRVIKGEDLLVDIKISFIVRSLRTSRNGVGTRYLYTAYLSK
jgi:hypothetical protein